MQARITFMFAQSVIATLLLAIAAAGAL